jgi:5-enolpyruvylshikimate-3-phosphate synthase
VISFIDRDNKETKRCNDHRYGMKFKSYKLGMLAGKTDVKDKELTAKTQCPYFIPEEVRQLLKKRARWLAGYEEGWRRGKRRK